MLFACMIYLIIGEILVLLIKEKGSAFGRASA